MDSRPVRVLSLCTGSGGLERGLRLAVGNTRVVCTCEIEAFAIARLAREAEEDSLGGFPIWSDVKTFDGRLWRGVVDIVLAGYPCQPFSSAGKRLGREDPRHLWPSVRRVVSQVRPGMVFFENVDAHLRCGYAEVSRSLERLGYRVTAGIFSAKSVGAPHLRRRLFILGISEGFDQWRLGPGGANATGTPRGRSSELEYSSGSGREAGREGLPLDGRRGLADAESGGIRRREASGEIGFPTLADEGLADSGNGFVSGKGRGAAGRTRSRPPGGRDNEGGERLVDSENGMQYRGEVDGSLYSRREELEAGRGGPGSNAYEGASIGLGDSPGSRRDDGESGSGRSIRDESGRPEPSRRRRGLADAEASGRRTRDEGVEANEGKRSHRPSNNGSGLADAEREPGRSEYGEEAGERSDSGTPYRAEPYDSGEGDDRLGERLGNSEYGRFDSGGANSGREAGNPSRNDGEEIPDISLGSALPLYPPRPNDIERWRELLGDFPELAPALEPELCRMADGMADRIDRLRLCGNGVVAPAAALAFLTLYSRLRAGDAGQGT